MFFWNFRRQSRKNFLLNLLSFCHARCLCRFLQQISLFFLLFYRVFMLMCRQWGPSLTTGCGSIITKVEFHANFDSFVLILATIRMHLNSYRELDLIVYLFGMHRLVTRYHFRQRRWISKLSVFFTHPVFVHYQLWTIIQTSSFTVHVEINDICITNQQMTSDQINETARPQQHGYGNNLANMVRRCW